MQPQLAGRVGVVVLLASRVALGFTPELHERLSAEAQRAAAWPDTALTVPGDDAGARFRTALWNRFAATADVPLRVRFLTRFPTPEGFDPAGFKAFLFLNVSRPVLGLDRFDGLPARSQRLRASAARWPDDDDRNADRLWTDETGAVRVGSDGVPLPADPAILDMGASTGVSSQAHSRYALLPAAQRTDSLEVLESEPWRFSLPRGARAFGGEFAAAYEGLAFLARDLAVDVGPEAAWFATAYEGLAWHHVQEAATQTQAAQVPSGDLFMGAQLSVWLEELRVGGGLFGPRVSVRDVGVRALTHFHLFHERLFADTVMACVGGCGDGAVEGAARAMGEVDEGFSVALGAATEPGELLSERSVATLVEAGAREAHVIHDHVRKLADPAIFALWGREVTDSDDPLTFLSAPVQELQPTPAWKGFFEVRARGFRRFNAVVRRSRAQSPLGGVDAVRDRLLRRLLDRHEELEARRAAFVAPTAVPTGLNKGVVTGLVALVVLSLFAARSLLRRRLPPRPPASLAA